jgi:hypothetical protein
MQFEAIHTGWGYNASPFLALGDDFRLWSVSIRFGVDVTFVKDIRSIKVSEFSPTAIALIVTRSLVGA